MNNADPNRREPQVALPALGLLSATLLVLGCFMLYQALTERSSLIFALGAQEQPLQQAQKIKSQLDALASATAKLADEGDAGAKQIVDAMKAQGIAIRQ
jgi:hypothetical protein